MGIGERNRMHEDCWIYRIQGGDEQVFELLFREYYMQLTRFAWRYVNSKAVAECLVQDVFAEVWEKKENFTFTGSIRSYLYKAVKNKSLNHLNRQKIKHEYDTEWMRQKNETEMEFTDKSREKMIKEAVKTAIDELPERSKMTYKLNRHDGLTYQEIAEIMDVSVKTVESQMTRTLKILRKRLAYLLPVVITR